MTSCDDLQYRRWSSFLVRRKTVMNSSIVIPQFSGYLDETFRDDSLWPVARKEGYIKQYISWHIKGKWD